MGTRFSEQGESISTSGPLPQHTQILQVHLEIGIIFAHLGDGSNAICEFEDILSVKQTVHGQVHAVMIQNNH